jgi:hypothetical protein
MTYDDKYILVLVIVVMIVFVIVPIIIVAANINSIESNNPNKYN